MPPSVILVLGMHRSGTSLATAILQRLGASLSDDLLEANVFNARGYFESRAIMQLHDRILAALGSTWRSPTTSAPFPPDWWNSTAIAPLRAQLTRLIAFETGRVNGAWAVKDPRASRLLPLWNAILDELGFEARYVISVRDPAEIAKSLELRDGIDHDLSDLLWLEHNADALVDGRGRIATVIHYHDWFDDPLAQTRLLLRKLRLPAQPLQAIRAAIEATVSTELRHHESLDASGIPYVDVLYDALVSSDLRTIGAALKPLLTARGLATQAARAYAEQPPLATARQGPTIYEITRRLVWREDVSEQDVRAFVDAEDPETRAIARLALSRSGVRRALAYAVSAAQSGNFAEPTTMNAARGLVPLTDVDTPFIEVLKHDSLQAIEQGRTGEAIVLLRDAFRRAIVTGQRAGSASRAAFAYLEDEEIGRGIEAIANRFLSPLAERSDVRTYRVTVLCSSTRHAARALERSRGFSEQGYDVELISLEPCEDPAFWSPPRLNDFERILAILERIGAQPVDAVLFMPDAQDVLARIVGCVGIAPIQLWESHLVAPTCGRYDVIVQPAARLSDAYFAFAGEFDAASRLNRAELGIADDAVVFATVGRLEKCAQLPYLNALADVLGDDAEAQVLIAGSDDYDVASLIRANFEPSVRERVNVLRSEQWSAAIKTADVYCDTSPWGGVRGTIAAMRAGLPIVAFADVAFASEALKGIAPIAVDEIEYRNIALSYLSDPKARRRDGRRLQQRARANFDATAATARLVAQIDAAYARKAAAPA